MNLNGAGVYAVPFGYPARLLPAWDSTLSGTLPAQFATVSAIVQTEKGTANVHVGLFAMPTTSGGNDGAAIAQTDLIGLSTSQQTITVTVPAGLSPIPYVVRVWVDAIAGKNAETISRDGSTAAASLPPIPTGVLVQSVTVS